MAEPTTRQVQSAPVGQEWVRRRFERLRTCTHPDGTEPGDVPGYDTCPACGQLAIPSFAPDPAGSPPGETP